MAAMVFEEMAWHDGERRVQELMHVPPRDNPTAPSLSPGAAALLSRSPLLAVGTVDDDGRVWTTLWGGEPGFARGIPHIENHIALKTHIDGTYDPVIEALMGRAQDGSNIRGQMVGALAIDLESRRRVKLFGRAAAAAIGTSELEEREAREIQLIVGIEQSLGNCPKYLNSKRIKPAFSVPSLAHEGAEMSEDSLALIEQADTFFVSSAFHAKDMSTNHRGGPAGFIRVEKPKLKQDAPVKIVWPEYSGNRLYQTLGRFHDDPRAGLVIPNFETGDVLYVSGTVEILVAEKANRILPRSNLAIALTVQASRLVRQGLFFRAISVEPSPYNPQVRKLASESANGRVKDGSTQRNVARLLRHETITPTISRFTFTLGSEDGRSTSKAAFTPGQWVALDFSDELDMGYSHMRDNDPTSLNDDLVRTFTVSSSPSAEKEQEFEMTIRKVGRVTDFLFQAAQYKFKKIDVNVLGFGGDFKVDTSKGKIAFVAGGVGITPLVSAAPEISADQITLFWTLQYKDLNLAVDALARHAHLAPSTVLFVTGTKDADPAKQEENLQALQTLSGQGCKVIERRLKQEDLQGYLSIDTWYLCCAPAFRSVLMDWLKGKDVLYEDFDF